MLIANVELDGSQVSLRINGGRVGAIGQRLKPEPSEAVFNARGGAVVPGLQDHHLHLFGFAAALASLRVGPAETPGAGPLRARLARAAGTGWLRCVGYHESVAGDIDRDWLDHNGPVRPIRIQHRSGRLWIFNSCAIEFLKQSDPSLGPLERINGRISGRLYDGDVWLRTHLRSAPTDLALASAHLAARGVTGVTDASYTNDVAAYAALRRAQENGALAQALCVMGDLSLSEVSAGRGAGIGAYKVHLHDGAYPDVDACIAAIAAAHEAGRGAAFHCVTEADLAFALACVEAAGPNGADRIEHASLASPEQVRWCADLGVRVVTQPHFIAERGDAYSRDTPPEALGWLYRARAFLDAGVRLAFASDAPYGAGDPWASMQAAVSRTAPNDVLLGPDERLTPEQALQAYLSPPDDPGGVVRRVELGAAADLCVLDRSWRAARENLANVSVVLTLKDGLPIYGSIASMSPQESAVGAETRRPDSAI